MTPRSRYQLHARHFTWDLGLSTRIMGIVNMTPDSFSGDGLAKRQDFTAAAVRQARRMMREGADLIDIGGESTRPGSRPVSAEEEVRRIIPAVRILAGKHNVPVSIDTYKTAVAREALDAGAAIINNIRGTTQEAALLKVVARYDAAIVLMHMRGTPATMQRRTTYRDVVAEISSELKRSMEFCFENGIKSDKIMIDPGIGFAKTAQQNLDILHRLAEFQQLKGPLLIGTSRKSFIGKVLNKDPEDRLWGTAATVTAAILNGAHVVRVHDVRPMADVARMADAILTGQIPDGDGR